MFAHEPYLQEYVSETLRAGVTHIVMLDANTDDTLARMSRHMLAPWLRDGRVSYRRVKFSYARDPRVLCAQQEAPHSRWVSIQDVDEFLTLSPGAPPLEEILSRFEDRTDVGGVAVSWRFRYPTRAKRRDNETMLETAPYLVRDLDVNVKTLLRVQPDGTVPLSNAHPGYMHYCECRKRGLRLLNLRGQEIPDAPPAALKGWTNTHEMYWDHCSLRGSYEQGFRIKASRGEGLYDEAYRRGVMRALEKKKRVRVERRYRGEIPYNFTATREMEAAILNNI